MRSRSAATATRCVLLTMIVSAALFLTTPYVGYLDNITVLYFLALTFAFFERGTNVVGREDRAVPARRSPPRTRIRRRA